MEPRNTQIYVIKNSQQAKKLFQKAKEVILEGGLVCFPTETVYGLGADATNDEAVADIFRAKNRSFENPIALHLHGVEEIEKYVRKINRQALILMEKFLPGPLMLIFEKNESVSDIVTGGQRKVGIRVPKHDLCLDFLKECGTPIAATSANRSGKLSCVKPEDIMKELDGKFDILLDMGRAPLGIESTALDVTSDPPRIIRPGFITMEEIAIAIGIAPIFSDSIIKPSAIELREESKIKIIIFEGDPFEITNNIVNYAKLHEGKKIGLVVSDESSGNFKDFSLVRKMGSRDDPVVIARNIFEILRDLEEQGAEIILLEGIPREGLGRTLMIRLCRMAAEVIKIVPSPENPEPESSQEKGRLS